MIFHRLLGLSFLAAVVVYTTEAFVPSLPATTALGVKKKVHDVMQLTSPPMFMVGLMSPLNENPQDKKNPFAWLVALILTLLVATTSPVPLDHGLVHVSGLLPVPAPLESTTNIILSKLEVQPLPGVGFGGLGIGPGFAPVPFGGFGMGLTVKNRPDPPTEQQVLEAKKQELQAVQQYEQKLQAQIQSQEHQQQQRKN